MKVRKDMLQECPKCGYKKCTTKLVIDNPKYPSGVILRCKQCKSIFASTDEGWQYFKEWKW
ncbi:hypothetical protein [Bacillus sp. AFS088145]|uniref:hypothetical protein n=1 Tax=Bacillus sp. AFS088145 TaxID=2033514 RepID=UPI000BF99FE1|nr:hypothetical protein [Bacillus sp. AFS088145]PFH83602.1 hypothetical protein COI44_17500 [Bacillus sp. AFS088145]